MTPPNSSDVTKPSRLFAWGEWVLLLGLAATLGWTTLCLGGFLAETMAVTAWAVFGLAAVGGVLNALKPEKGPFMVNRAVLLPVPFLLFALASVLWLAPARWLAWREWLLWLQMWLVFALVLHFGRGRRQAWLLVGTLAALGLAGVAMAACQRYSDPTWLMMGRTQAEQFFGRSSGMFGIPNSLAGLLELMIPVCLTLLFSRATKPAVKIACAWLAGLFIFAVVLTGSRGGWIALGLAATVWPVLSLRDWRKRLAGSAAILALASGVVWALYRFSENARQRIEPFLEGRFESSRPIVWKAALQIWGDHRWLGGGAASYNVLFDQYRPRGFLNQPEWAHNDYLNTLSDFGAVGFALWLAAGGGFVWLGWQAVQRARRENVSTSGVFELWPWRLGLFLGGLAFALHLGVDFHTKLPALAFAVAIVTALLVRDEPGLWRPVRGSWFRVAGIAVAGGALLLAGRMAAPLYRAEALRYDSRRAIDRFATTGQGSLSDIIPVARANLTHAVQVDPTNGQAWADLSYAVVQGWNLGGGDLGTIGRQAEPPATQALALCPINAEFWVRKGVALDLQSRQKEGEACFRRALELAPETPASWYYFAYHLQAFPTRKSEAMHAVDTCLALDPSFSAGVALRQQLMAGR